MIWKSNLISFNILGKQEQYITSLFANDTTVFLLEWDRIDNLFDILKKWCKTARAHFNHGKTKIIQIGSKAY